MPYLQRHHDIILPKSNGMPDDSCRRCGGLLMEFEICGKCREPTRLVCRICCTKTEQKFHDFVCFKNSGLMTTENPIRHLVGQA
jgi:hypothetical protein